MEPLEARLLLDATPFLVEAGNEALNVTLAVADISGVASIRFIDNTSEVVIASRALADTSEVVVTGSDLDDILTIDLGEDGGLGSIPIAFDGASGLDTLLIAGGPYDVATYDALGLDTGAVTLSGSSTTAIAYTGIESVIDIADAVNRTFVNATNLQQEIRLSDDGDFNGLNLIDSDDTGGFTPILFAEPTSALEIRGSDAGDSFFIGELEMEFVADVSIQGGAGFDTLTGPNVDSDWQINGADTGTLNTAITFLGIENLTGTEDTDDTFVVEAGGSFSGLLDGGAGGFDSLLIRSAEETAIVNPGSSGSATFDGRTINYAGLEPVVDSSDAATTRINGTNFADDLILDLDPSTPGNLRLRINGARFLNNGTTVGLLSFVAPTGSLILDLRAGDDRLTLGNLSGVAFQILLAGGIGDDRLAGSNIENTWQINGADGGTLNGAIDFAGIENLSGGNVSDTFSIALDGSMTGVLDGGAGNDELKRLIASSLWTITGANAGHIKDTATSETIAEFAGIENLSGDAEGEDTFYLEPSGSVSGFIEGGLGALDQLLIEGTSQTVVVIPDATGIATFGGRTVHYSGLELFVDTTDPAAIVIRATVLDDELMLSDRFAHLNEPEGVELSSVHYRFLSGGSVLNSIIFSSSGTLSVSLRQGDDILTFGSIHPGLASTMSIDAGDGDDELRGSDSLNLWRIDGADSGVLNFSNEFEAFENLRGGNEQDIFGITSEGSLSGRLDGHLGDDNELRGPSQSIAWNINGPDAGELIDQLTGATLAKFDGIRNLLGAADNVDSFIISEGGDIDGSIDGGEGGSDSLVIRGTPDTVVVPGLLFGQVFFDTVTINGVTVTYKGMEPFVADSNAADVTINGTGVNDELTLAPDPDNAGMMRISGSSSFLFYTNGTFSDGISFANPTLGLSINLRFGDDTLTLAGFSTDFKVPVTINGGWGSDSVSVTEDLFLPGQNLTINTERISIADGVTVSTRQIGGSQDAADHLNAASTGASGDIVFNAESEGLLFRAIASVFPSLSEPSGITIGIGSVLLAHVDVDHLGEFDAGDITLWARDENGFGLAGALLSAALPLGVFANRAEVNLMTGAVVKGGNLNVAATAKFSPQPDFLDQQLFDSITPYSFQETLVGDLLGKIPVKVGTVPVLFSGLLSGFLVKKVTGLDSLPLRILGKIAEARIDIGANVEITASGDVTLEADAFADATTKVDNPLFSLAFSLAHSTAEVLIGLDSHIQAGGNVNAVANSSATAKSEASTAKNKTKNPNVAENLSAKTFSLSISELQNRAHSILAEGARIDAGGNVNIVANGISTTEAGAKFEIFLDGTFGVSAGVGFAISDIKVEIGGTIVAGGELEPSLSLSNFDATKDTIDLGVNPHWYTGQSVVYHEDPDHKLDNLADGKTYFVIAVPGSKNIKLAADLKGALEGKAIDLKAPAETASAATLENTDDGISILATLVSEDKASAEAGIGDTPSTFVKEKLGALAGTNFIKKLTGKLGFEFIEKKRNEVESGALTASGASSKPSDYSIAGAIAFSRTDHDVNANVLGSATLKSGGDVDIRASLKEEVQTLAETAIDAEKSANAKKKKSGSIALIIGLYNSEAHALIGDNASVDASGALTLESRVLYPFLTEPNELFSKSDFTTIEGIKKLLDGKLGLQDKLLNSWAVSSANADELAIAGSINWLDFNNVSEAVIGSGARINQDVLYQDDEQAVSLTATTEMQLVNMTGVFDFEIDLTKLKDLFNKGDKLGKKLAGLNPLGPGFETDGKGFGGSLFVMLVDNQTTARVASTALVRTGNTGDGLHLQAESKMFDLSMVQSGGSGGQFGAAGSFSFIKDDGITKAQIESGAQVHGGPVDLAAADDANHWNAVGGFMKGEARGVGVSVAINLVSRDTAAFIGNEASTDPGAAGTRIDSSGDVTLTATGTGSLHTFSLAAAFESNKAMKGDAKDPLDGVSLPILFGEAEPEKEPAKTGLGIAGSVAWNTVNDQTRAYIHDQGTIKGNDIALTAHNDRGIVSASGAAAITKTGGSEKSTALSGAFSLNQLKIDTLSFITGATIETVPAEIDDPASVTLTATRDGLLFSFSGGGAGAAAKNGTGGTGSVSINRILDSTEATLDGVTITTGGDVALTATDESNIISIAGAGAYGTSKGVGGAIAINQIAADTQAAILGDSGRSTIGSEESPIGALTISARNDNSIQSIAVSVGASKGGGLAVTLAINLITTDPVSGTPGSVEAAVRNADVKAAGDISITAQDDSTLEAIGGAIGIGGDKFGFGAALGWNEVSTTTSAVIEDATVTTTGFVHVTSEVTDGGPVLDAKIAAVSVGAAGSSETSIGGALSINVIQDSIDARISGGANVAADGGVHLTSTDRSTLKTLTGGIAISTSATAAGVAIGFNDINNSISSVIDDADVTSSASSVELNASSDASIGAITIGGAGAGKFAIGGSVAINLLLNTIDAHVTNAEIGAADAVIVSALDNSEIFAISGGVAGAGKTAIGAALATNDIANTTTAYISASRVDVTAGSVEVTSDSSADIQSATVSGGGAGSTNINGSIAVHVTHNETSAYIGSASTITADGNVIIAALDELSMLVGAGNIGGAGSNAVGVSSSTVITDNTTEAYVADGVVVSALGNRGATAVLTGEKGGAASAIGGLQDGMTYFAIADGSDPDRIRLAASAEDAEAGNAIDLDPSSATGNSHELAALDALGGPNAAFDPSVDVDGGEDSIFVGAGHAFVTGAAVIYKVPAGENLTRNSRGLSVTAVSFESLITIAAGGQGAGSTGAAGSVTVNVLNETTRSYIGSGARINEVNDGANPGQSVNVLASDELSLFSIAGAAAVGGSAGIGAGADVGVVTKRTEARIDDTALVVASNDVEIRARSVEAISSLSAALSGGGSAGIAGAAAVYVMNLTTIASIGSEQTETHTPAGATVHAGDSVVVSAEDSTELDLIGGTITAGGSASLGAAAAVPVINKTTEAFIGANSTVSGLAQGDGVEAYTGLFAISFAPDAFEVGEVPAPLFFSEAGITLDVTGDGIPDINDPLMTQRRSATPLRAEFKGVAVTAVNRDDVEAIGASGGGAGSLAVSIGGAVQVITTHTRAFIDADAEVNPGNIAADGSQSVLVAAGNDLTHTGMALVPAGAGTVAVTPGVGVSVVNNTTEAFIADGADVLAAGNIAVVANALEDILSLSAGVAVSGLVSVGGAVSVITVNNETYAYIGDHAADAESGATALAGGSILVSAQDITDVDLIAGSLGVGIGAVGVGASVGVTVVHKNTRAFIGDNAAIEAKGHGDALDGIYNGTIGVTGFSTRLAFHGLAVQAGSAEDIVSVAAAGAGGFYAGVAGGVSSVVVGSETSAFIGADSKINQDPSGASDSQSVSVAAVNSAKVLGVTGGLGIGIAGIGGAVDIGVIRNDAAAFIAEGADVHAQDDVDLHALSVKDVHTLAVAAAGGIVGAVGSVSVWTIGSEFESSYESDDESRNALTTGNGSTYPDVQSFADAMAGGKIAGNGFKFIVRGYSLPEFNPSTAVDDSADTIDLGPNHGLNQGDAVVYRNGGGESIGGLEDGTRYYVILDSGNSNRVQLAATTQEALDRVSIDLDRTSTTGSHHHLEPYVGATASSAGNTIDGAAPNGEVGNATSSAQVPNGTKAYIASNASIIAGGDVRVHAGELINYDGQTGSVAVGVGGIGGSVTIASIQSHTDAHVAGGATVLAGGIANTIVIDAFLVEHIAGSAFAGQAGLIAIGAQVVVVNDNSTQTAYIADNAIIGNAAIVSVLAGAERTIIASATGGGIGGLALGAAVTVVNVHGGSSAFVDGATVGRDQADPSSLAPTVGDLIVAAEAVITAEAHAVAVQAGLGGGAANASVALTKVDPTLEAFIGNEADVLLAHDAVVQSRVEVDVHAEALGVSVDLATGALGASVAMASLLPEISAYVGGSANLVAGNNVTLRSASNYDREGRKLRKGAHATATSGSGGQAIGGSGAFATVENSPDVETYIDTDSVVTAGNDVLLTASANNLIPARLINNPLNPSQQIEIGGAQASGAGFGALGIGISVSEATIGGSVLSHINGATVNAGHDLGVTAESIADASAKAWAVSGGIAGGTGNEATISVKPEIGAYLGSGASIFAGNDVGLGSNSEADIAAQARGLSVAGVAIGVSLVDADISPSIATFIAPGVHVVAGGDVSLASLHNYGLTGPLDKGTSATGNSSGGGVLAGNGVSVSASSSALVDTFIGAGATIGAGQDVLVTSFNHNQATASGTGSAVGVVGIGAILADAEALSATRSHVDGAAVIVAGRDVTLLARTVDEATATATASGGGLASGTGADSRSNASPLTQAFVGSLATVNAGRDILIAANVETHSTATSTGTTAGGVSVGASFAEAKTIPVVSASVGESAVLQAGHGITVSAQYNIDDDGDPINTVKATATGSAGSLLAGILAGADASTVSDVRVRASIGVNAHLDITANLDDTFVTVVARAHNSVQTNATGNANGLFAGNGGGSGTQSKSSVHTEANTVIGNDATIGELPTLHGNLKNATISSIVTSVVSGSANGASGKDIAGALSALFSGEISLPSILSGGGSVVDFDVENAANTVISAGAAIRAEGQVSITADSTVDVNGTASMTSGGVAHADAAVLVDVFLDSDAVVTIAGDARIEGGSALLGAHNQIDGSAVATAKANVSLGVADAAGTARFNVGSAADPSQALVTLGSNTILIGRNALNIEALNDQVEDENLLSKATASSFGAVLTGDAIAEANGTVQVRSTVTSGENSVLSSGGLSVNADSTVGIDRIADSDAASIVTEFVRQAKTVVRKITRWLPWPLNKIVEFITETIFVLVPKVTAVGSESAKSTGSGVQAKDTVDLNGDIFSFGTQNGSLIIQTDPNNPDNIVVDPSSNMSVTLVDVDGDGITDISVGDIVSGSSGNINITAPKGDIIGNARVHINKVIEEVHIVNGTNKNLVINRLDMVGSNEEDPDLNFQSENGQEYEVDSEISSSALKIENNGSGDIIFAKAFSNVTALLDVFNQGGDIRVLNSDVYLETGDVGHLSLKTEGGSIGTADLPFRVRLVRGKVLPDGALSTMPAELSADASGAIFLDVTGINNTFDEFDSSEIVDGIVLNLTSVAGDIQVIAREGVIIDTITQETTNENGETVVTETEVSRAAAAIYELKQVRALLGDVAIDVTGDLNAGQIGAPAGTVLLKSTGSILHANNTFAGEFVGPNVGGDKVVLMASSAIGSPVRALTTQAGNLEATAPTGIWITNLGPLAVAGINSGGPLVVGAASPLSVIGDITSVSDLVLFAGDSPAAGDDLIITAGATVRSTSGSVTLFAGDNFRLDAGSSVIAAGALNIMVDAGDADPGVGGTFTIEGLLFGNPVVINGGSDNDVIVVKKVDQGTPLRLQTGAGNDLILVGSHATLTSNTGGTLHTILDLLSVDGGPGFDELRFDHSGVSEDVTGTLVGGQLLGLGLKATITWQNMDSVVVDLGSGDDTFHVGDADSHVTLNMHAGHDRVEVGAMRNGILVDLGAGNDKLKVSAETIGSIVAYGGDGNDHLAGGKGDDLLNGGAGNDKVSGGWGDDILLGDAGNDRLSGGPGRDVLIGGTGHDKVSGGGDGDLLIGGTTGYDNNVVALRAIGAEWSRRDVSEHERIRHLTLGGGLNGAWLLNRATVLDDHAHGKRDGNVCTVWLVILDDSRHEPPKHNPPAPPAKPEEPKKPGGKK